MDGQVQLHINRVQNVALANLNWRLVPFFRGNGSGKMMILYSFLLSLPTNRADCSDYYSFRAERYWIGDNGNVRKSCTINLPVQKAATAT